MHYFITLFLCVICTPMANSPDLGLPLCGTQEEFMIEGPYPGKHLKVLYRSSVVRNLFCPTFYGTKGEARGWDREWLNNEAAVWAGGTSHWQKMEVIWVLCLGMCWAAVEKSGGAGWGVEEDDGHSLLDDVKNCALSFLWFHDKCFENKVLKPFIISVQGKVQYFQSLLLFFFRPKLLSKFVLNQQMASAGFPKPHSLANNCIAHK